MEPLCSACASSVKSLLREPESEADAARAILLLRKTLDAERDLAQQLLPKPEGILDIRA
jgi:hypothetical protein